MKLRPSLVGHVERYIKRAIGMGKADTAAELEQLREDIAIVESATNLCLDGAELADYLIYNATRGDGEIEPAAVQQAYEIHALLAAFHNEIEATVASGNCTTPEASVEVLSLIREAMTGIALAIDVALDRYTDDVEGGAADAQNPIAFEIEGQAVAVCEHAAYIFALLVALVRAFQRWLLGCATAQHRGPPCTHRPSRYERFAPVGAHAPPATPRQGALVGRVLIRGC